MTDKKCPFRVDENGDLKDCLGAECMAFYEYDAPEYVPTYSQNMNAILKPVHMRGCLRMTPKPVSYCGVNPPVI